MTGLTEKPEQVDAGQFEVASSTNRSLTITVMVLAVAVLGLGTWVVYDRTTVRETAATEEIQTLLDDYLLAWNSSDGESFLELVTVGYTLDMVGSSGSMTQKAEEAYEMLKGLEARDWNETMVGDPIMAGDGPWYVSLVEHFSGSGYGPEGADGVSTFTIIDDGGTLRVARHDYVGNN